MKKEKRHDDDNGGDKNNNSNTILISAVVFHRHTQIDGNDCKMCLLIVCTLTRSARKWFAFANVAQNCDVYVNFSSSELNRSRKNKQTNKKIERYID